LVVAAKDVVRRLLCVDPVKRISLAELLHHPWFSVSIELFLVVPHSVTSVFQVIHRLFAFVKIIGIFWTLFTNKQTETVLI